MNFTQVSGFRKQTITGNPGLPENHGIPRTLGFRMPRDSGNPKILETTIFRETAVFRSSQVSGTLEHPYRRVAHTTRFTHTTEGGAATRVEKCCISLFLFDSFSFCIAYIRCVVLFYSCNLDCILEGNKNFKKGTIVFSVFFLVMNVDIIKEEGLE